MNRQIGVIDVAVPDLELDPENPRLPEELQGGSQAAILEYMFENGVLDELARSYVDNGFFRHEPLLVAPKNGTYTVLEGNRRLAALKILLREPEAVEAGLEFVLDPRPSPDLLESLREIPSFLVADRDEVRKYLGFRHIGGIKTWSAEAKARYLADEVAREVARGSQTPFADVARRVGSNTQGVRNAYVAMSILRKARDDLGVDVQYVQHNRFGVWLRAMNSPELRRFVGFEDTKTFEGIKASLEDLSRDGLLEVIQDMTPPEPQMKPLLADSRDVTWYARILLNERARDALRRFRDFGLARQIVEQAELPSRVRQLIRAIEVIVGEIHRTEVTPELAQVAEELFAVSQSLLGIARIRANSTA